MGLCWNSLGAVLGQCGGSVEAVLGQCWDSVGVMLGQCGGNVRAALGQHWGRVRTRGSAGAVLGHRFWIWRRWLWEFTISRWGMSVLGHRCWDFCYGDAGVGSLGFRGLESGFRVSSLRLQRLWVLGLGEGVSYPTTDFTAGDAEGLESPSLESGY